MPSAMHEVERVLVYGTLREGENNWAVYLRRAPVGTGRLQGYCMHSLGPFPAIVAGEGEVTVEEYLVTEHDMSRLDRLEGYPHFYDRAVVASPVSGEPAWVYFIHRSVDERVESGDWLSYKKERRKTCVGS